MKAESDIMSESLLQFFGNVTASISHEINNVLAIINENAGLLEDFILMEDKGIPINRERLKTLAGKITTQIKRADNVVRNMNKFAHSVDESIKRIDLCDLLKLMVTISNRSASMRGVSIELNTPENPVFITTNEFFLENYLWSCLDFTMDAVDENKSVVINTEDSENCVIIRFSRLKGLKDTSKTTVSQVTRLQDGLLGALKGRLTTDTESGEIILILLKDINRPITQ